MIRITGDTIFLIPFAISTSFIAFIASLLVVDNSTNIVLPQCNFVESYAASSHALLLAREQEGKLIRTFLALYYITDLSVVFTGRATFIASYAYVVLVTVRGPSV